MSEHRCAPEDVAFAAAFEQGAIAPEEFTHAAHLRLAYVYLTELDVDGACARIRRGLQAYLAHHGLPADKYHETLTRAWVLAVRLFMRRVPSTGSAGAFLAASQPLLDPAVMLTHYTRARLYSAEARRVFVVPDLDPIPDAA